MKIMLPFYMKLSLRYAPMIVLVVVCQLVLGQLSSAALGGHPPKLSFALAVEGAGEYAKRFERSVMASQEFEVIRVSPDESDEKVFGNNSIQCIVTVPEYFDERVERGEKGAVVIVPAPGIADISALNEYIAAEIMSLRAGILLGGSLRQLGVPDGEIDEHVANEVPLIETEYDGPPAEGMPLDAPPRYGVPALFLLLAFLFAAHSVPGRDTKRIAAFGSGAMRRGYMSGMASALALWTAAVAFYALCMRAIYGAAIPGAVFAALLAAAWYACALGGLLAMSGRRVLAAYIFVPWLLANMTLGGGLWGNIPWHPALAPLLPVSAAANAAGAAGGLDKAAVLFAAAGVVVLAGVLAGRRRFSRGA
jgi:hypothetical protein